MRYQSEMMKILEELHKELEEVFDFLNGRKQVGVQPKNKDEDLFEAFLREIFDKDTPLKDAPLKDIPPKRSKRDTSVSEEDNNNQSEMIDLIGVINRLHLENYELQKKYDTLKSAYDQLRSALKDRGSRLAEMEGLLKDEADLREQVERLNDTVEELRKNSSELVEALNVVTKERDQYREVYRKLSHLVQKFNQKEKIG